MMLVLRSPLFLLVFPVFGVVAGGVRAGEMEWIRVGEDKHSFVRANRGSDLRRGASITITMSKAD